MDLLFQMLQQIRECITNVFCTSIPVLGSYFESNDCNTATKGAIKCVLMILGGTAGMLIAKHATQDRENHFNEISGMLIGMAIGKTSFNAITFAYDKCMSIAPPANVAEEEEQIVLTAQRPPSPPV